MISLRPKPECDAHFSCPTCRDEGLPGRVLAIDENSNMATVKTETGEQDIALDLVDGVQTGDFVLVHLAVAIAKLNPADVVEL